MKSILFTKTVILYRSEFWIKSNWSSFLQMCTSADGGHLFVSIVAQETLATNCSCCSHFAVPVMLQLLLPA